LEKKARGCQEFLTRCCSTAPMADVEASVPSVRRSDGSGCASNMERDKFALHFSNASWSSGVHVVGWEPLTWVRRGRREVLLGLMPRGAIIACSSSACPGNGGADWRF
jgi:hypothetical protein